MAKWDLSDLDRTAEIHNADMTALTDMLRASKQRNDALDELYKAAKRDAEEAEAYAAELEQDRRKTYEALLLVSRLHSEVEAKLAKAVEALDTIDVASNHYCMTSTYSESALRYALQRTRKLARATLAELTGGKNE